MLNVAIFTGGPSAERGIALKSADLVSKYLDKSKYVHRIILVDDIGWFDMETNTRVDLNTCSLDLRGQKIKFDFAFLIIHGTPVEDGRIQGYFEMMGIPHSTCDTLTSAITFNKQWCKDMLSRYGVPMADSRIVPSDRIIDFDPQSIEYPVFVKPNNNGSSYGVSKVMTAQQLPEALGLAAKYDTEIMVEAFLEGREFSCGVVAEGDKVHVFPITEIIPDADFFDYNAKYLGAGQEITPADLPDNLTSDCQEISARLYRQLNCMGMVRFDYILVNETFYLLEVNTVPGLSEASIIPQQARAYGWSIEHLLDVVIETALRTT